MIIRNLYRVIIRSVDQNDITIAICHDYDDVIRCAELMKQLTTHKDESAIQLGYKAPCSYNIYPILPTIRIEGRTKQKVENAYVKEGRYFISVCDQQVDEKFKNEIMLYNVSTEEDAILNIELLNTFATNNINNEQLFIIPRPFGEKTFKELDAFIHQHLLPGKIRCFDSVTQKYIL